MKCKEEINTSKTAQRIAKRSKNSKYDATKRKGKLNTAKQRNEAQIKPNAAKQAQRRKKRIQTHQKQHNGAQREVKHIKNNAMKHKEELKSAKTTY